MSVRDTHDPRPQGLANRRPVAIPRYVTRQVLGLSGRLVPLLSRGPGTSIENLVNPHTHVCIEGFPRSGNTLAVEAFARSNPALRTAHHVHAAGQFHRAARYGVPCALVVRNPADAVASLVLFYRGSVPPAVALASYIAFHRAVTRGTRHFVACDFAEVLGDPLVVVRRLNEGFGTRFAAGGGEPNQCAETGRGVMPEAALPVLSPEAQQLVEAVRSEIRRLRLFRAACALYDAVLEAREPIASPSIGS